MRKGPGFSNLHQSRVKVMYFFMYSLSKITHLFLLLANVRSRMSMIAQFQLLRSFVYLKKNKFNAYQILILYHDNQRETRQ